MNVIDELLKKKIIPVDAKTIDEPNFKMPLIKYHLYYVLSKYTPVKLRGQLFDKVMQSESLYDLIRDTGDLYDGTIADECLEQAVGKQVEEEYGKCYKELKEESILNGKPLPTIREVATDEDGKFHEKTYVGILLDMISDQMNNIAENEKDDYILIDNSTASASSLDLMNIANYESLDSVREAITIAKDYATEIAEEDMKTSKDNHPKKKEAYIDMLMRVLLRANSLSDLQDLLSREWGKDIDSLSLVKPDYDQEYLQKLDNILNTPTVESAHIIRLSDYISQFDGIVAGAECKCSVDKGCILFTDMKRHDTQICQILENGRRVMNPIIVLDDHLPVFDFIQIQVEKMPIILENTDLKGSIVGTDQIFVKGSNIIECNEYEMHPIIINFITDTLSIYGVDESVDLDSLSPTESMEDLVDLILEEDVSSRANLTLYSMEQTASVAFDPRFTFSDTSVSVEIVDCNVKINKRKALFVNRETVKVKEVNITNANIKTVPDRKDEGLGSMKLLSSGAGGKGFVMKAVTSFSPTVTQPEEDKKSPVAAMPNSNVLKKFKTKTVERTLTPYQEKIQNMIGDIQDTPKSEVNKIRKKFPL